MLIERKWKKWVFFYLPMVAFILFKLFLAKRLMGDGRPEDAALA